MARQALGLQAATEREERPLRHGLSGMESPPFQCSCAREAFLAGRVHHVMPKCLALPMPRTGYTSQGVGSHPNEHFHIGSSQLKDVPPCPVSDKQAWHMQKDQRVTGNAASALLKDWNMLHKLWLGFLRQWMLGMQHILLQQ